MAHGCEFISFLRNAKPVIEEKGVNGGYLWLLDNSKTLKDLISNPDLSKFLAACCYYENHWSNTEKLELVEELKKFLDEIKKEKQGEKQKHSEQTVLTLTRLPDFGFQYPSRIKLLFDAVIKEIESIDEDARSAEFIEMRANLTEIHTALHLVIGILQNNIEESSERKPSNLTRCFHDRLAARNMPNVRGVFEPPATRFEPVKGRSEQGAGSNMPTKVDNKQRRKKPVGVLGKQEDRDRLFNRARNKDTKVNKASPQSADPVSQADEEAEISEISSRYFKGGKMSDPRKPKKNLAKEIQILKITDLAFGFKK